MLRAWPHRVCDLVFMTVCLQIIIAGITSCMGCTKSIYIEPYWKIAVKVTYTWHRFGALFSQNVMKNIICCKSRKNMFSAQWPSQKKCLKKLCSEIMTHCCKCTTALHIWSYMNKISSLLCVLLTQSLLWRLFWNSRLRHLLSDTALNLSQSLSSLYKIIACWWWQRLSLILFSPIVVTAFNQLTLMKYPRIWSSSQHLWYNSISNWNGISYSYLLRRYIWKKKSF